MYHSRRTIAMRVTGAVVAFVAMLAVPPPAQAARPAGSSPVTVAPACPGPTRPGEVTCDALVRTDIAAVPSLAPNEVPSGYSPADLAQAYSLRTNHGAGATVAMVNAFQDPTIEHDLGVYREQFGLPPCTTANGCFHVVNQHGDPSPLPLHDPRDFTAALEQALNVEMVSAVCPLCHILLVEANSSNTFDMYQAEDYATAHATYVSNNWGLPEYAGETADDAHFNRPGVVITASTGDNGHAQQYPATSPYVTAVGGTSLHRAGNARGFTEDAWDSAGSACSTYEPRPAWQLAVTTCDNRAEADVSATADPSYPVAVYDSYGHNGWITSGGTSVSTPIITAIYALAGTPRATDYPVTYLYTHAQYLNDITTGDANGNCGAPICDATTGWDGPSGLGSPNGSTAFTYKFPFSVASPGDQHTNIHNIVNLQLQAFNGDPPYHWAASGLPIGLDIDLNSGMIFGQVTQVGNFGVTIFVADSNPETPGIAYSFHWLVTQPMAVVPSIIGLSQGTATNVLNAAGLVMGAHPGVVNCNFLNEVASQTPDAGTVVPYGTAVDVTIGRKPSRGGCP